MPGELKRSGNATVCFLMIPASANGGSLKTDGGFAIPKLQLLRTQDHGQFHHGDTTPKRQTENNL